MILKAIPPVLMHQATYKYNYLSRLVTHSFFNCTTMLLYSGVFRAFSIDVLKLAFLEIAPGAAPCSIGFCVTTQKLVLSLLNNMPNKPQTRTKSQKKSKAPKRAQNSNNSRQLVLYKPRQQPLQNIQRPIATAKQTRSNQMSAVNNGRMCRMVHREFVALVSGTVAFTATNYSINPSNSTLFPWLASQAIFWEQYRFTKLTFEYITRCSATTSGSVLLAPDYDVLDAPPATEVAMCSYADCVECAPWTNIKCALRVPAMHSSGPRKFTRSGVVPNSDQKTYDVGSFNIATVGMADTAAVGKLWVDYVIELYNPQMPTTSELGSAYIAFLTDGANTTVPTATSTVVNLPDHVDVGRLPLVVNTSDNSVLLPLGTYNVTASVDHTNNVGEETTGTVCGTFGGVTIPGSASAFADAVASPNRAYTTTSDFTFIADGIKTLHILAYLVGATGTLISKLRSLTISKV